MMDSADEIFPLPSHRHFIDDIEGLERKVDESVHREFVFLSNSVAIADKLYANQLTAIYQDSVNDWKSIFSYMSPNDIQTLNVQNKEANPEIKLDSEAENNFAPSECQLITNGIDYTNEVDLKCESKLGSFKDELDSMDEIDALSYAIESEDDTDKDEVNAEIFYLSNIFTADDDKLFKHQLSAVYQESKTNWASLPKGTKPKVYESNCKSKSYECEFDMKNGIEESELDIEADINVGPSGYELCKKDNQDRSTWKPCEVDVDSEGELDALSILDYLDNYYGKSTILSCKEINIRIAEADFWKVINEKRFLADSLKNSPINNEKLETLYFQTSFAIIKRNKMNRRDDIVDIDLHKIIVPEIKVILPHLLTEIQSSKKRPFIIDCGKGLHSRNNKAVLKPIVMKKLTKEGLKWSIRNNWIFVQ